MGARENKVEKYLDSEIIKLGGITRKWVSPGRDGVPDRICLLPGGVVYFVEVKTVDGSVSEVQKREQKRIADTGAFVRTVFGEEEVDQLINCLKLIMRHS